MESRVGTFVYMCDVGGAKVVEVSVCAHGEYLRTGEYVVCVTAGVLLTNAHTQGRRLSEAAVRERVFIVLVYPPRHTLHAGHPRY